LKANRPNPLSAQWNSTGTDGLHSGLRPTTTPGSGPVCKAARARSPGAHTHDGATTTDGGGGERGSANDGGSDDWSGTAVTGGGGDRVNSDQLSMKTRRRGFRPARPDCGTALMARAHAW
jgi:hypothetical protein